MTAVFVFYTVLFAVGVGQLIDGGHAWGEGKPQCVISLLCGLFMVVLAIVLANGERDRRSRDRISALEAQLAKQQPVTQNTTTEQK